MIIIMDGLAITVRSRVKTGMSTVMSATKSIRMKSWNELPKDFEAEEKEIEELRQVERIFTNGKV